MNSHRMAAAALGLFLAGPAAGLMSAETATEPVIDKPLGWDEGPSSDTKPKKKVVIPPRAELDRMILGMGQKVATFYETRLKLREYLDSEDNTLVLQALKEALPKTNKIQRFHIVRLLGDWGKPEGLALIAPYVEDKDDSVQRAAMSGVTRAKDPDPAVLSALRPLLTSRDDNVQKEAILSVGRMKDLQSVPLLIEMLRGDNQGLRTNVLWALKEITGKDFGFDADAWQNWWNFYQREVLAKRKPRAGQDAVAAAAAAARAASATSMETAPESTSGRYQLWLSLILALLILALPVAWGVCRWWLRATMNRLLRVDPAAARDPTAVALRFSASDHMPDWIVYPFLARCMGRGSALEISVALNVLMFRLHGGCAATAVSGGRLASSTPTPGARERIAQFPRGLIADMALAGYQSGRCLLRIAEPENPVWRRDPTPKEKLIAERHLSALLKRGS